MGIEAIKAAGMAYQGGSSAAEVKENVQPKIDLAADSIEKPASESASVKSKDVRLKNVDESEPTDHQVLDFSEQSAEQKNAQIKKAVEDINKKATNSEAIFGIHEKTNRVMIKIIDKDTKEVIKEFPPEKTLDMIAKAWEMAGLLVDEKR